MKVHDPNLTNVASENLRGTGVDRAQQAEQIARRGGKVAPGAGETPDSVAISGLSAGLRAVNVDSPQRVARIEKLGDDVAAGKYQVDAGAVSRSIIENALRPRV